MVEGNPGVGSVVSRASGSAHSVVAASLGRLRWVGPSFRKWLPSVLRGAVVVGFLVVTHAAAFVGGAGFGAWRVADAVYHHGPTLASHLLDFGMRLTAFDQRSDIFEWEIKGLGVWAANLEELGDRVQVKYGAPLDPKEVKAAQKQRGKDDNGQVAKR